MASLTAASPDQIPVMAIFHRRPAAAALVVAGRAEAPTDAARTMIWSLEAGGWTEREAGNLVGLLHGLRPAKAGWTEREIEHLRFLRALVDSGRLEH
jgi:hypothetical protein